MALNAIDGMMARELAMASDLGAMLNELGDALSDLTIYLSLAFVTPAAQWPAIAFAIGAVMTEFCGLLGRALGASRRYDGPMGKSDRALLVGALGLFTALIPSLVPAWPRVLWLGTILTGITCLHRLARALKEIRSR
jgi:phosphatidylglycerophosphate synthase